MNRKHVFIIIMLFMIYASFLFIEKKFDQNGQSPTIQVPQTTLKVSVKDKESILLKDVRATDDEDGNLSSQVYIENISAFQNNQKRIITYAVIDSDDNITRTTRELQYTDYKKPDLYLTDALCLTYIESTNALKDYVAAKSVVDGDLSSKISVDRADYQDGQYQVTYSVTDSCGVKVSLKTNVTLLTTESPVHISLKNYSLRVKKGTEISPQKYIDKIDLMGINYSYLKNNVTVSHHYDASQEGTYEFLYRIKVDGEVGITKLIVIVEEDENE